MDRHVSQVKPVKVQGYRPLPNAMKSPISRREWEEEVEQNTAYLDDDYYPDTEPDDGKGDNP